MLKGYAVNEKRLEALNKTVEIQSRMISSLTETSEDEVYEVVKRYTEALTLLDGYDHQCLNRPEGTDTIYRLSYEECRKLIDSMAFDSDVFGVEREKGKLEGILLPSIRMSSEQKFILRSRKRLPTSCIS